jgi:hypothetical protein
LLPLTLAAALILGATAPGTAPARAPVSDHILIVTDVSESAQPTMPASLWRKLALEYVGARSVTAEDGTALPDDARCRADHAMYAVFASFDRAMRLPGFAQDTSRAYGIARFTVRNCLTGAVSPTKTVRIESDPITEAERDREFNAERTWERAARAALARDPLALGSVARIVRIDHDVVMLENGGRFSINQVLRVFADADAKRYADPVELIVLETEGKYVQATVVGTRAPHVGDYVEAAPL